MIEIGNEDVETSSLLRGLVERVEAACMGAVASLPAEVGGALIECSAAGSLLRPEHRIGSASSYTRHILHADPKGRFAIVALVWQPGQYTLVHGHYTWCAYCVVQGSLQEELYAYDRVTQQAQLTRTVDRSVGACGYGHGGTEQIHRLGNGGNEPAVSIHIYGVDGERVSTHVNRLVKAA
ncbi:cysteine dioxygenase [Pusillimonas sp. TS35]|nr:cysteine dioxygenase [Pusillimonas sp. TS35]